MSRKNKNKEMKNSAQAQSQTTASEALPESETPEVLESPELEKTENPQVPQTAASEESAAGETRKMFIQFGENEVSVDAVYDRIKQECKEAWQEDVKDLKVYVKPEDNRAYYVLNGEIEGSIGLV